MLAGYPLVPLFENQGLAVALCYDGGLLDLVPDLDEFVEASGCPSRSSVALRGWTRPGALGGEGR